jgi:hypothetical protein
MAFGRMTIDTDNSIFFGQPLIDAYILQEELYFYGVIAHASIEQQINEKKKNENIEFVCNYSCHFKKGNSVHLTIVPMFLTSDENYKTKHDSLFASINRLRLKTSGYLRKYIDNTELYLNEVKREIDKREHVIKPALGIGK